MRRKSFTASLVSPLFKFNRTNGAGPVSLVLDTAGNFYGVTTYGGITTTACPYGCGTIFKLSPPAAGQTAWTVKTLVAFNGTNGMYPNGRLALDKAGNLYGTTQLGGNLSAPQYCASYNCGTVFKLSPPAAGQTAWTVKTLVAFNYTNGSSPMGSLTFDAAGKLYGTTSSGGGSGYGTVFQLSPPAAGQTAWTFKTLATFNNTNGKYPYGSLTVDAVGNLYGTTSLGGANGNGTAFRLSPPAAGQTAWTFKTLASFNILTSGTHPTGLTIDKAGNLYGTTTDGGTGVGCGAILYPAPGKACGTVFMLSPPATGQTTWTLKVLATLNGTNGKWPTNGADVVLDAKGNVYGTAYQGGGTTTCGLYGCGTVFKLLPPAAGQTAWTFNTLAKFNNANGAYPVGLALDTVGNLYGTTTYGGDSIACPQKSALPTTGCGTVFKIIPGIL
jgi:uncharacterized repeat protein (TIGR03803 family)